MSKAVLVTILSACIVLINVLYGFPSALVKWVTILAGLVIVILGLLMRVERLWLLRQIAGGHTTDTYAENGAQKTTDNPRA